MIDGKTRNNLLQEIEKTGNVYLSCLKVGVNKATYYRWRQTDKAFRKQADNAIRCGRENLCDIAEHALMINVKGGKMDAIKYALSHNSPRYKPKDKRAIIVHTTAENNEDAIAFNNKERERHYYDGYSDAIKKYTEDTKLYTDKEDEEKE